MKEDDVDDGDEKDDYDDDDYESRGRIANIRSGRDRPRRARVTAVAFPSERIHSNIYYEYQYSSEP